ncbi:MAG TPA: FtsX-like permease family protein [Casimicrobiaceae bacterium]|nr:FtsX-like permease family protein [Casimicrobiaceae bacterium]
MLTTELKLAVRNLARERKRTLISLAAIVVGVVGYLLAGGFIDWIFWAIRESAIDNGLGHIQISAKGYRDAGQADPGAYMLPANGPQKDAIARLPGVVAVSPRLMISGLVSHGEVTVPFAGEAVEPDVDARISKDIAVDGEPLDAASPKGVILGRGLARALNVKRGDVLAFITTGASGGMSGVEGIVRGVYSTGVKAFDDVAVRMPLALGQQLMRTKGVHLWVVGIDDTAHTQAVASAISPILADSGKEMRTWLDLSDFYRKTVTLMSRQMLVVAVLIAIILVLGIANLLTMSTLERTGEIGTMLALGTPRSSVLRMHFMEGLLLGLAGAIAGLAIGAVLAAVISWIGIPMPPPPGRDAGYRAEILLSLPIILDAVALALASAAIAGAYPAWKASRMPIVDALRFNR